LLHAVTVNTRKNYPIGIFCHFAQKIYENNMVSIISVKHKYLENINFQFQRLHLPARPPRSTQARDPAAVRVTRGGIIAASTSIVVVSYYAAMLPLLILESAAFAIVRVN
jgi:hypothetical protein